MSKRDCALQPTMIRFRTISKNHLRRSDKSSIFAFCKIRWLCFKRKNRIFKPIYLHQPIILGSYDAKKFSSLVLANSFDGRHWLIKKIVIFLRKMGFLSENLFTLNNQKTLDCQKNNTLYPHLQIGGKKKLKC